jgi:hypothetical protein
VTVTEETRHQLYVKLEELLGHAEATVLMEHLPPVGWADVGTKRDVDALAIITRQDLDAFADRFRAELHAELHAMTSRFVTWLLAGLGVAVAANGAVVAALT